MPNRIRSHVLEERSLAFLREVFPDSWVIHHFTRDYGIDIQVELFTENGDRTGIRFYGQVKATDKPETADLLRLDRSHFEYWSSHTDPVVLFRYFDKSKQLHWRWLHDLEWLIKPGSESIDIASLLKTWHQDASPTEVEKHLYARRQALFEPLTPPYEITIEQFDETEDTTPVIAAKIAREIQSKSFRVLPKAIAVGHFQLLVARDKLASSYSGLPGFVFHYDDGISDDDLVERALLATFLCACRYERILFARSLAALSAPLLYKAAGEELKAQFFDAMIFSLGLMPAVNIITPLLLDDKDSLLTWLLFSTTCGAASWRYGEAHSWTTLLRQWLENPPLPENAGPFAYNLGNTLASQGHWEEARDAYTSALTNDPAYNERPYFWAELGGANFETERFEEASRCYEKALQLENSPAHRWRLADALFHSAKFAQAKEQLEIALPEVDDRNKPYVELLSMVCDELHNIWGLDAQILTPISEEDQSILQQSSLPVNVREVVARLRPLMNKNAIDGLLNFNAGVFASRSGHYSIAAYRFLTCALRQRGDAEAWTNSIACALNAGNHYLAVLTAKNAHFFLGEEFLPWALGMMPDSPQIPEQISDLWRSLILGLTESFERDRSSREDPVLRIHTREGTEVFKLDEKKGNHQPIK